MFALPYVLRKNHAIISHHATYEAAWRVAIELGRNWGRAHSHDGEWVATPYMVHVDHSVPCSWDGRD